jgi:SAM-dependent methyltransferase
VLDLRSRDAKASKIERLLGLQPSARPLRILEIGTGSGGIAHYFATHPDIACEVDAVDVTDTRQIRDRYRFTLVDSPRLPFPDTSFDVVLTNHVIEHVGDEAAQRLHLDEVRRVMKADGVGYLAVPNRWMLVEPHYQLAFLSWLPQPWRTPYLRWRGRGTEYDCRPLTTRSLEPQLRRAGFDFTQQHGTALRMTYELERPTAFAYRAVLKRVPDAAYAIARHAFPTLIYLLRPSRPGA